MSRRPHPPPRRYSDQDSFDSPDPDPSRPPPSRRAPPYRTTPNFNSPNDRRSKRNHGRPRSYPAPNEKSGHHNHQRSGSGGNITLRLCVYDQTNDTWRASAVRFDPARATDIEVWSDIREVFRQELQGPWRRIFGFKKVKSITPCEFTRNDVPIKPKKKKDDDDDDHPESHLMMHCYHHPLRVKTDHDWVDWFTQFDRGSPDCASGLQFTEGLWADKLAAIAIILTIAIIVASAVWCALGGELQTVFTVMSFILSGVAAEVALIALYFQVTLSG